MRVIAGGSSSASPDGSPILTILVNGFPKQLGQKEAPKPSVVKKEMKKLMKQSASSLKGKKASDLQMEIKALAESTASTAREKNSDESRFTGLLEARRLYLLGGEFRSAFAITDELSDEYSYDYWTDLLAFFLDAAKLAGKDRSMQRQVISELGPAIVKAEEHFEFEAAGKLAGGGKMLATALKDQRSFEQFGKQMEEFEQNAKITKQARLAAKTLTSRPEDSKANRVMAVFCLVVTQDWDDAMRYFARSDNKDCEFIAKYDRSFNGDDAKIAMKLADCWRQVGKKNDEIENLAIERAREVLMKAKGQALGEDLEDIESDLERQ